MQLISNAKDIMKMTSAQIAAGGVALGIADQLLPVLHGIVPPGIYALIFGAVIIARSILQPKLVK